jgi:hypothetical protein
MASNVAPKGLSNALQRVWVMRTNVNCRRQNRPTVRGKCDKMLARSALLGEEITQHQALPFCVKMSGQLCHSTDTLGHPGPALHNNRSQLLRVKSRTFDIVCTHSSPIVHGRRKMGNGIKGGHEQAINWCHTHHRCQHGWIPAVVLGCLPKENRMQKHTQRCPASTL